MYLFRVFLSCFLITATLAQAQTVDQAELNRQLDQIQRQIQDGLLPGKKKAPTPQTPSFPDLDIKSVIPKIDSSLVGAGCHPIEALVIHGDFNLSRSIRQQLNADFSNRCIHAADIEKILGIITKDYIDRGYLTTRAYLPAQDLATRKLEILIVEGVIENIVIDDGGASSISASTLFPSVGAFLNLRDLEQGISQINRLSSNNAQLDIQPGQKPGGSVIVVHNQPSSLIHVSLGLDDQGSTSTGKVQASLSLSLDRLLGLNEQLTLTHREAIPNDLDHRASNLSGWSMSIPFAYSLFSISSNRSTYVTTIHTAANLALKANGSSQSDVFKIEHVIHRNQDTIVSVTGSDTLKNIKNYLSNEYLGVSSRKLSIFDFGFNLTSSFLGGVFGINAGFSKGLKNAGALIDAPGLANDAPRAQFKKDVYGASYSRQFKWLGMDMSFSSELSGQLTQQTLYGSEQFSIGGISSVRGFYNNTLSGDSGYSIRNELATLQKINIGTEKIPLKLYAALDWGRVRNNVANIAQGRLAGVAIGMSLKWKALGFELFAMRPISYPSFFTPEKHLIFARWTWSF